MTNIMACDKTSIMTIIGGMAVRAEIRMAQVVEPLK